MSSGPQRIRLPEVLRVIEAVRRAANVEAKDVRVEVTKDASWTVYAVPPNPQGGDKPLDDGGDIVL
jgi:hypothetical protein